MIFLFHRWDMLVPGRVIPQLHPETSQLSFSYNTSKAFGRWRRWRFTQPPKKANFEKNTNIKETTTIVNTHQKNHRCQPCQSDISEKTYRIHICNRVMTGFIQPAVKGDLNLHQDDASDPNQDDAIASW